MEKIFKPFIQAESSITRQYGGTGLGLSICTRLAELMGGDIRVESTEGVGSTFFLQVPFGVNGTVMASRDGERSGNAPLLWDGPSLRILLVDDVKMNLMVTARVLKQNGHSVVEAHDGREAVQASEQGVFDLIVMDIRMPFMDGVDATQVIRSREKESGVHTVIIAATSLALQEERDLIMSQGFDGYISKPIEFGLLFAEIRRFFSDGFLR
jgi:two-component system, sensor histidine kinase